MIPVRVPANPPLSIVAIGVGPILPEHPLASYECPVCDGPLVGTTVSLVYVGTAPEDRKDGWHTGAAVAVHDTCTGVDA